jgi:voltage-gated potassium channel
MRWGPRPGLPTFLVVSTIDQGPRQPRLPRRFLRARALWRHLQAENFPRLALATVFVLVAGGITVARLEAPHNEAFRTIGDGMWWAVVTLTTIGYGDKFPTTTGGRLVATVVVLFGIGMVGIVTGKVASVLVEQRIKEGRGLADALKLSRHCVILGWKTDMHLFVADILAVNRELGPDGVVVVNMADEVLNQELRHRFRGLVYIRGDVIDGNVLQRANVARAAKVIVLADALGGRPDQEVDARTVMAVMTVKNLAPEVYTCAEILDKQYRAHLQLASCDEIVLSREYSRFLLVNATRSAGITHVLHELLDITDRDGLATLAVPGRFVGRTAGELAAHVRQRRQLLVGLLENTGHARAVKREALRDAQKTANVATLMENLKRVKELMPNRPYMCPADDHVIGPHTMAIVIGPTLQEEL